MRRCARISPRRKHSPPHRGKLREDVSDDDAILGALATLSGGQTLGRYELLTPVGRGGMALVWAARLSGAHGFSKLVAIKTILPHLASDPRFEQLFLREARIASRIHHPNVCQILDLGEQSSVLYLVMEWVDGASLMTFVEAGAQKLPLEVAVHVVAEAGRGLEAAHELGVVHRDVSPHNILVTAEAAVKIVDFGVAKATLDHDQTTQSGFLKGKVAYVAPEQVNEAAADVRSDVFALSLIHISCSNEPTHPKRIVRRPMKRRPTSGLIEVAKPCGLESAGGRAIACHGPRSLSFTPTNRPNSAACPLLDGVQGRGERP